MSEPDKQKQEDPFWWTPWAVLIGLLLYGLLGFLGKLSPSHSGPTAADVPVTIPSATAP
jgi:hypothetical protein